MLKLFFVNQDDNYYHQAIQIRIALFFQGMEDANTLIDDEYEKIIISDILNL